MTIKDKKIQKDLLNAGLDELIFAKRDDAEIALMALEAERDEAIALGDFSRLDYVERQMFYRSCDLRAA